MLARLIKIDGRIFTQFEKLGRIWTREELVKFFDLLRLRLTYKIDVRLPRSYSSPVTVVVKSESEFGKKTLAAQCEGI